MNRAEAFAEAAGHPRSRKWVRAFNEAESRIEPSALFYEGALESLRAGALKTPEDLALAGKAFASLEARGASGFELLSRGLPEAAEMGLAKDRASLEAALETLSRASLALKKAGAGERSFFYNALAAVRTSGAARDQRAFRELVSGITSEYARISRAGQNPAPFGLGLLSVSKARDAAGFKLAIPLLSRAALRFGKAGVNPAAFFQNDLRYLLADRRKLGGLAGVLALTGELAGKGVAPTEAAVLGLREVKASPGHSAYLRKLFKRIRENWNEEQAWMDDLPPKSEAYRIALNYCAHLAERGVNPHEVDLVAVERGGRTPALILKRIAGVRTLHSLPVVQNRELVDEGQLEGILGKAKGRHLLFVDAPTARGRQAVIIERALNRKGVPREKWSISFPNQKLPYFPGDRSLNLESPSIESLAKRIEDKNEYLGYAKASERDGELPAVNPISPQPSERRRLLERIARTTSGMGKPVQKKR